MVPKLSPINNFVRGGINALPQAQNALLKFAVNQPKKADTIMQDENDEEVESDGAKTVPIANFKSNKLS